MASPKVEKWEVVKKTKKPGVQKMKKINPEDMPRIEQSEPMHLASTAFDAAFNPKAKPATNGQVGKPGAAPKGTPKKPVKKKPQANANKDKPKKLSLDAALAEISVLELQKTLDNSKNLFPKNPEVWLLDITGYLELQLDVVAQPDPFGAQGGPLSLVKGKLLKVLKDSVKHCSEATLELFFWSCAQQLAAKAARNEQVYGLQIFIQLLCKEELSAVFPCMFKLEQLASKHKNNRLACTAALWCARQLDSHSLSGGLEVWFTVMQPLLGLKAVAPYCLDYLHDVVSSHEMQEIVTAKQLLSLMEVALAPVASGPLTAPQQRVLQQDYYDLRKRLMSGGGGEWVQMLFRLLLVSQADTRPGPVAAEMLKLMIDCLKREKACFSLMRQLDAKHVKQTTLLLRALCAPAARRGLDVKLLRKTAASLILSCEERAAAADAHADPYLAQISRAAQELLETLSASRSSGTWRRLVWIFLTAVLAAFAWDVYAHGGVQGSKTAGAMERVGAAPHIAHAYNRVSSLTASGATWLSDRAPDYCSKSWAAVKPALVTTSEKVQYGVESAVNASRPVLASAAQHCSAAAAWVYSLAPEWFDLALTYCSRLWQLLLDFYHAAVTWLLQNVFTGQLSPAKVQASLTWLLTSAREHLVSTFDFCVDKLQGSTVVSA